MSRLLLDQGLPRSAAAMLQKDGWDAVHTFEAGLSRATDEELLEVARRERRVVVTLDADFHALLAVANADSPCPPASACCRLSEALKRLSATLD